MKINSLTVAAAALVAGAMAAPSIQSADAQQATKTQQAAEKQQKTAAASTSEAMLTISKHDLEGICGICDPCLEGDIHGPAEDCKAVCTNTDNKCDKKAVTKPVEAVKGAATGKTKAKRQAPAVGPKPAGGPKLPDVPKPAELKKDVAAADKAKDLVTVKQRHVQSICRICDPCPDGRGYYQTYKYSY
ncbi:hypothetical protein CP533_5629 [Ophiocordyceps camponoti-saundersi (nom. inval.)]|nr:hypothetical protein CP533_5629 [Ophiocordyceps camponoti-saundersi (nom. inval.)]